MAWQNLIDPSHEWGMGHLYELYMWTSDDKHDIIFIIFQLRSLEKLGEKERELYSAMAGRI